MQDYKILLLPLSLSLDAAHKSTVLLTSGSWPVVRPGQDTERESVRKENQPLPLPLSTPPTDGRAAGELPKDAAARTTCTFPVLSDRTKDAPGRGGENESPFTLPLGSFAAAAATCVHYVPRERGKKNKLRESASAIGETNKLRESSWSTSWTTAASPPLCLRLHRRPRRRRRWTRRRGPRRRCCRSATTTTTTATTDQELQSPQADVGKGEGPLPCDTQRNALCKKYFPLSVDVVSHIPPAVAAVAPHHLSETTPAVTKPYHRGGR